MGSHMTKKDGSSGSLRNPLAALAFAMQHTAESETDPELKEMQLRDAAAMLEVARQEPPPESEVVDTSVEIERDPTRALLDQLLEQSKLYSNSSDYKELLDFTVRLRTFAPFNAMLLQIQKPGLTYAATAMHWLIKFGREVKPDARPLLIMWPFGPVSLVYDVQDTEGDPLPNHLLSFPVIGRMERSHLVECINRLGRTKIYVSEFDGGDAKAGSIRVVGTGDLPGIAPSSRSYQITINRNHSVPTQYATLIHELGHLYLGHLGEDKKLNATARGHLPAKQMELEAESLSYIVCGRAGLESKSQKYLSQYVDEHTTMDAVDLYQVMRASRQVEKILALDAAGSQ
jgi:hypothetical protein